MKILLTVSHRGIHTGGSVQLAQLAAEFTRRGHDVTALFKGTAGSNPDPSLERLEKAGVRLGHFNFRKLKYKDTISELMRLRRFLKAEEFDVVHCFKGTDFDFITLASMGIRVPALFVTRGMSNPLDFWNSFKYRRNKLSAIIAVSGEMKRILVKTGRVNPDKVEVIYAGVDLSRFDPAIDGGEVRDELGIQRDAPVVGIIGTIDFRPGRAKGGFEFAHAAKLVMAKMPRAIFLCVGGIDKESFKPLENQLGIGGNFVFTGFRTDVPRMLAAMNLSVCASIRSEGLTGVVRESLAMRIPVVSTNVGGNRELVIDGRTGFLVPPGNPEALAEGILRLLENPPQAAQMGEEGRKLVSELCDFRKQADAIEALYKKHSGKN